MDHRLRWPWSLPNSIPVRLVVLLGGEEEEAGDALIAAAVARPAGAGRVHFEQAAWPAR